MTAPDPTPTAGTPRAMEAAREKEIAYVAQMIRERVEVAALLGTDPFKGGWLEAVIRRAAAPATEEG